jgi:hypothetical protein
MNIQGFTPQMTAPVQANSVSSRAVGSSTNSGGSTSATSASSLQGTFLNLLVTELQNQDPTSPVDPTEMVGQMVSLNQLDQLISINQSLSTMSGSSSIASGSTQSSTANVATALTDRMQATPNVPASTSPQQLYVPGPNDPINLYGDVATSTNSIASATTKGVR